MATIKLEKRNYEHGIKNDGYFEMGQEIMRK